MAGLVLITGASGFLGLEVCKKLTEKGFSVRALVRNPQKYPEIAAHAAGGVFACDFRGQIDPAAFEGEIQALVHCAYEMSFRKPSDEYKNNIEGTLRILELSKKVKQFVFISTVAAHADALSFYGRGKYELEEIIRKRGSSTILKPGMILGSGGVFRKTRELVKKLRLVPLFFKKGSGLQTVWVDDLCEAIFKVVEGRLHGTFITTAETGVRFDDFYRGVGALDGIRPILVSVPGNLVLFVARILEGFGIYLPITSETLLNLKFRRYFPSEKSAQELGIAFCSFEDSLKRLTRLDLGLEHEIPPP